MGQKTLCFVLFSTEKYVKGIHYISHQRCSGLSIHKKERRKKTVPKYMFPLWRTQEALSGRVGNVIIHCVYEGVLWGLASMTQKGRKWGQGGRR